MQVNISKKINNYDVEIEYDELEMESEDYYGERIYNYDKYMYEKLWDHYISLNESSKKEILVNEFIPHLNSQFYVDMMTSHEYYNGTTYWQQKRLINDFVYNQWKQGWVNYDLYGFRLKPSNFEYYLKEHKIPIEVSRDMPLYSDLAKKEKISEHSLTAYGLYNDGRLLTNYNWTKDGEKIADMEWNQIILDQSVITGTMVLEDKSKEKVSLERYFWNGETHMTGPDMTKHLKNWGFIK
ncbi:Uncharacterised protein [Metamycoplasma cloacale]|uniref:Uncharacterized protein n=1 Tax=Metamycoplasma cloacale TaxID=92401 RepID=A0A2Z4LNU9_9BACT|nr:hypothetical protein [Metamycoplasma cloacale]AWX42927.1 hypothetical protein DK849_02560 [Metamycoplasma cloacale]VEU79249.1 Uncharacterised protein [Metamycoplasma cloacale]